jgi:bis(5'-nucleosyl)-tetraphosphatase (symmetrical)
MVLKFKGEPGEVSDKWTPWFDVSSRRSRDHTIVCGHWSALGVHVRPDLLSLDGGCVWGRTLTAVRLEDRKLFEVGCPQGQGSEE